MVRITTGGDRNKDAPLLSMERGMFVRDIEQALLAGEVDFAVHSAKDVPISLPDGVTVRAAGRRKDPRDALVNRWGAPLSGLPPGARLGTSSPRRTAQLKAARPDIELLPIRGNVGTRLDKAGGPDYDGVVLAAAGLQRLGRTGEVAELLAPEVCTPDVGQGTLAVEARSGDAEILDMLGRLDHPPTTRALAAERAFLAALGGGCKSPVAAYARPSGRGLRVYAMAATPDGGRVVRVALSFPDGDAASVGSRVAEELMKAGAAEFVE